MRTIIEEMHEVLAAKELAWAAYITYPEGSSARSESFALWRGLDDRMAALHDQQDRELIAVGVPS